VHRRRFLRVGAASALGVASAASTSLNPGFWQAARATGLTAGPYGALDGRPADANGLVLPEGFTSRVLAITGSTVEGTEYVWHPFPDGGATFVDGDGWIYVSNSEFPVTGGVGALRFDADGLVTDAYPILDNTSMNCAGGPTPWGTWLSCEEFDVHDEVGGLADIAPTVAGQVWECDPTGVEAAQPVPAMGLFQHEAAAVAPESGAIFLTEDQPDGLLYRFTPDSYPELAEGRLEAATVVGDTVSWSAVPDPSASDGPTRYQVPGATPFNGGEGIWYDGGVVYFTTKGDGLVRALHLDGDRSEVIYDPATVADGPLRGVDNITVAAGSGDIFVAEDGDNMELVLITPERAVAPFLRIEGHPLSEVTGPAFSPAGDRLYFSSQRGSATDGLGVTYEVTGPFRQTEPVAPTTTLADAAADESAASDDDDGDSNALPLVRGAAGVAAAAAAGGLVALRSRRSR
jgi:secreted PhoX family phosphatase